MKKLLRCVFVVAVAMSAIAAGGQNTQSGYFVDDYTYSFQLNPAYGNNTGFVSMPVLGNVDFAMSGNVRLTDVFYNVDGKTTTFMNPGVKASDFLGLINDVNKLSSALRCDIVTVGFKAFGGYNTVNVSARADAGMRLPKSLFSLLKEGVTNRSYKIEDVKAYALGYAQIALGHSRDINEEWRVGLTAKMLLGVTNVNAHLRSANLTLNEDFWTVTSDAKINASMRGLSYETEVNDDTGHRYVSGMKVSNGGIGGYGFALDIGAIYRPVSMPDFTFSAAVLDFGGIGWCNNMLATTDGVKSFTTEDYVFNVDDKAPNSVGKEIDRIREKFSALYELEDCGDRGGGRSTMLAATLNLGAEYVFPLYRPLTFGLLNTTRINGEYSWTDFRLSANVAPISHFSASANIALGTRGFSFGWLLNLSMTGFNIFAGMDHTTLKVARGVCLPLSSNASFNFGLNFSF